VQIDFFSETNNLQRLRPTSEFNFAFNFAFNFDLWCYMSGYAELPDGKVLSGTESGKLLLWDGGLIKTTLMVPSANGKGKLCHAGAIEVIKLDGAAVRRCTLEP